MKNTDTITIIDFDGQYGQFVARRVRELNVYSVVLPNDTSLDDILAFKPKGIILVNPHATFSQDIGVPVLSFYSNKSNPTDIIKKFVYNKCGVTANWSMTSFAQAKIKEIKDRVGNKKALLALSGGVDSSVCGILCSRAIGANLTCVFVDTGLMRHGEGDQVEELFENQYGANFIRVNAGERFLGKLSGVVDPEQKRKIIGEEFIRVMEEEAKKIGHIDYLVQGTIYPDIIESGTLRTSLVKTHHNVGGLPDVMDFKEIIEPLRDLFKDEVRVLGQTLGMNADQVYRQPFPGPGLGVRILGEITPEKVAILQKADHIFTTEIEEIGLHKEVWQYFAVLTGDKAVGVKNHKRTYGHVIALRAVESQDAMTASWSRISYELLVRVSQRITTEVKDVVRVVYDITSKPPGTIEWE